jgi:anti-sigma B factor antagonist
MKLNFNKVDDALNLSIEGRLDTTTAPELDSFLTENLDGVGELNINCEKLVYLSSAGLRVLLVAHKKMQGKMKLSNVCDLVMEVFELTGFADILVIE